MNSTKRRFPALLSAILRRLALAAVTVAGAALLSAALARFAPGAGMDERSMDLRLSEQSIAALEAHDAPGLGAYLVGLAHGDWGTSISLGRPVRDLVAERAGLTGRTLAAGLALAWIVACALAAALQLAGRRGLDAAAALFTGVFLCLPAAAMAILFLHLGGGPAAALAAVLAPRLFRYVRRILAAAAARPFVLAARARGVGPFALVWRHMCVPAAPELLALAGVSAAMAVGAVIPVEALLDSPGAGQLVWESAMARDVPVLISLTAVVALVTCAANLLSDIARTVAVREV